MLPTFTDDQVHISSIDLSADERELARCLDLLSVEERQRSQRFSTYLLRRRFILARGALRQMLSRYVGADASAIQLAYGRFGKPRIAWPISDIAFNLSHADNMALCAVARGVSLGIDIEQVRTVPELRDLVSRFFSTEEISDFGGLPRDLRQFAFFTCWTRKEAYVKAVGLGLSIPLNSFQVSLCPGQPPVFVHIGGNRLAARSWSLHHFEPTEGFVAALAYPSPPRVVQWVNDVD